MITCNWKLRALRRRAGFGAAVALGAMAISVSAAQAAPTRLAGTDAVGEHNSSAAIGGAEVYATSASAGGTVESLSLYVSEESDASAIELGLYSDEGGQPTTLLTSGRTDAPVAGWNTIAVPAAQ